MSKLSARSSSNSLRTGITVSFGVDATRASIEAMALADGLVV